MTRYMHYREEYRAEIFVIATWSIRNRRNALHFGQKAIPVDRICSSIGSVLQEFLAS